MKKLAVFAIAFMAMFGVVLAPAAVHAQVDINDNLCEGIGLTDGTGECGDGGEAEESIGTIITTIIDIFSIVVGAVSVIMIILGGLRYITSSGDSAAVTSAKNTILYAIVGLIIVIFAQTIVKFVVGRLTNS